MSNLTLPTTNQPSAPDVTGSTAEKGHVAALDGLRFFAFLGVYFFHSTQFFLNGAYFLAEHGVHAFFVLSGFLIGGILLRMRDENAVSMKDKLKTFYIRRSLRIFPVYYLVMIITTWASQLPLVVHGHHPLHGLHPRELEGWDWFYLSNIKEYLLQDYPNSESHLWSLAVEEQFYLLAPFALLLFSTRKLSWAFVGIWIATIVVRYHQNEFTSLLPTMQFGCLTLGIAAAIIQKEGNFLGINAKTFKRIGWVCFLIAIPANFEFWHTIPAMKMAEAFGSIPFCAAAAAFILMLWNGGGGVVNRVLSARPIAYLGRISYGLYIYHLFILDTIRFGIPYMRNHQILALSVALGITLVVSMLSWHFFEKPINDLKRFFPYPKPTSEAV